MTKTANSKGVNLQKAVELCTSDYQISIVQGRARLSGADLEGKAKFYGATYAKSRQEIKARLTAAGIPWRVSGTGRAGSPMYLEILEG